MCKFGHLFRLLDDVRNTGLALLPPTTGEDPLFGDAGALGEFMRRKGAEEQAKYSREPFDNLDSQVEDEESEGEEGCGDKSEGDEADSRSSQSDKSAEFREHEKFIIDLSDQILNGDDKEELFAFQQEEGCSAGQLDLAMSYSNNRIEEFSLKKPFREEDSQR